MCVWWARGLFNRSIETDTRPNDDQTQIQELEDRSIPKLSGVVQTSFNFCTAAFIFMMSCGFLTFGGASQGLILNNYAEQVRLFF